VQVIWVPDRADVAEDERGGRAAVEAEVGEVRIPVWVTGFYRWAAQVVGIVAADGAILDIVVGGGESAGYCSCVPDDLGVSIA
jgi:hypothetical protein